MSKQTAVEWLDRWFRDNPEATHEEGNEALQQAKEMEKQQIMKFAIKAVTSAVNEDADNPYNLEQLFIKTYGSKGSDEHIVDTNEMIDHIGDANEMVEISDESWEGCDGCTEQDEVMYFNGYAKGYNAAISELPKEISDEEIYNKAVFHDGSDYSLGQHNGFIDGAKWYREQLKKSNPKTSDN